MKKGFRVQNFCFVIVAMSSVIFLYLYWENTVNFHSNYTRNMKGRKQAIARHCNMYRGRWVYDDSYPLYNSSACPYIRRELNCLKNGRPDQLYLKYRWQPTDCDLPRFDGHDFLKRFRGKKIMFIGDSISPNHGSSLICLLHAAVPDSNITMDISAGPLSTVTFQDYEVSVMIFRSMYLVDIEEEQIGRVLKLDSIKNGEIWKNMDILIFNNWLWWYRRGNKQPWDYIQEGDKILKDMDRMDAFRKALMTWAKWVDSFVNPEKTRVFFQGISPGHYYGAEWNKRGVHNCSMETLPIMGSTYPSGLPPAVDVVKEVLSSITKNAVNLLDITLLSQLRKDAHPSTYIGNYKSMDCTHWCVGGVTDTWNQLLYATLIA